MNGQLELPLLMNTCSICTLKFPTMHQISIATVLEKIIYVCILVATLIH